MAGKQAAPAGDGRRALKLLFHAPVVLRVLPQYKNMLPKPLKAYFFIEPDRPLIVFPDTKPDPFLSFPAADIVAGLHQGLSYTFANHRLLTINPGDFDGGSTRQFAG